MYLRVGEERATNSLQVAHADLPPRLVHRKVAERLSKPPAKHGAGVVVELVVGVVVVVDVVV